MFRLTALITGMILCLSSYAQTYKPVEEKSAVKFKIRNFGFNNVTGSFKGIQGTIKFSPENLAGSSVDVTVESKTVNSGINLRDNHLRKEEYFDVKKYPVIRFVSVRIPPAFK